MRKFKEGDLIRFIGRNKDFNDYVTSGRIYEVNEIDGDGDAVFTDDRGDSESYISMKNERLFELVTEPTGGTPVEASPSVIELLSNLALRLTAAENEIAELNEKQAIFYDIDKLLGDRLFAIERQLKTEVDNDMTTQSERIESVCNEVRDLLIRKNHDYGDSFSKQFAKYGVMSGLIRMDDKIRRLETLVGGEEAQVSESIEDTIADLAGYALLTLVELRKGE